MKVAINVLPLQNAHKHRGIGYYTRNLVQNLKKDPDIEVLEFTNADQVKGADLIHYPWFDLFFHTLPLRSKIPTIVTVHDTIPLIFPKNYPVGIRGRISFHLQKIALGKSKFIITDSKRSKEDIVKYLNIDPVKIKVVYLAADSKFKLQTDTKLLHAKRKHHLPDNFLLYVGDANFVKNLPFLLEGFNKLLKEGFTSLKLVLVGGAFLKDVENIDHPELQSLRQLNRLISEYSLKDKIIRPGQVTDEELVDFYNLATVYIEPSIYEGFGLPILQAFSCGTPVVCSNRGSLSEIGGDAAVYFDPSNINQFISIVSEVLENKSLQNKLSKLGLQQASKFSWEKTTTQTKQVYETV